MKHSNLPHAAIRAEHRRRLAAMLEDAFIKEMSDADLPPLAVPRVRIIEAVAAELRDNL